VWTSPHFVYHARAGDASVSADVLPYLEANLSLVAQGQLGLDPQQLTQIPYFKYRDLADFEAVNPCSPAVHPGACVLYYGDGSVEIHSPLAVDEHELVHAYARRRGYPPLLLTEGLAVSLSCDWSGEAVLPPMQWSSAELKGSTWSDFYDFSHTDQWQYFVAGLFTTWLVDHVGMNALLDVYGAPPVDAGASDFAMAVESATGSSLDDLWQAMISAPSRRPCSNVAACTILDPASNPLARDQVALPVPAAGMVVRSTVAGTLVPPAVRACSTAGAMSTDIAWPRAMSRTSPTTLFLPGSDGYVLTSGMRGPSWNDGPGMPTDFTSAAVPPSSVGTSCTNLQAMSFEDPIVDVQVWPSPTPVVLGVSHFAAVRVPGNVQASVLADRATGASFSVDACSTCANGALADCQTLTPTNSYVIVSGSTPLWLSVSWNPPTPNDPLTLSILY
jgi:hypothetical protein